MAGEKERWQVFVLPAQPIGGAIWSGSFAEKPDFNVRNGVMHITGGDGEPEIVVSLSVAMSIMFASQAYIDEYQPQQPPAPAGPPGAMGSDPGAGF